MNEWYYYQEHGKTVGPFSVNDIRARIKDGRVRVFDLVFKDGEASWRMALEHSNLRSEFKSTTLASLKDKPWVCLQKKSPDNFDFVTSGPFSQDEIRSGLLSGKISYSDYAWKDAFPDWKRIGSLEEFNPRVRNSAVPPVPILRHESSAELLNNVVELKRPTLPIPEPVPPEAVSQDLTQTTTTSLRSDEATKRGSAVPPALPRVQKKKSKPVPPPVAKEEVPDTADGSGAPVKTPIMDWGLVGVLALVLAGVILIVSRFFVARDVPIAVNPPPVEAPAEPEVDLTPEPAPEPVATAAPPAVTGKTPTELHLAVQAVGTNQARIELRTDGSSEFPVYVQVIGLPGQVTEGGAYYRLLRLTPTGDVLKPLDVSNLKLASGKFVLKVETGEIKKQAKLNLGLADPQYKANVSRQRKLWAHAIWKERLALFRLSQTLEKQIRQALPPTMKFSSKGLDPLNAVKRAQGANFLLFEDWWELHEILKAAKTGVNVPLLNRTIKEKDRLAAFSVWK